MFYHTRACFDATLMCVLSVLRALTALCLALKTKIQLFFFAVEHFIKDLGIALSGESRANSTPSRTINYYYCAA